jgi:RNA polymerase sigma-70 factor (ECF subfamily)
MMWRPPVALAPAARFGWHDMAKKDKRGMDEVKPDSAETRRLLERARTGDRDAFEELFRRHRPFVRQVIDLRLDDRLRARVDPSDIVQETQMEAFRKLPDYLERESMPFRLWLRHTAYDRLLMTQRHHLGARRRSVERELQLPESSSFSLAGQFLARGSTPSQQLSRRELVEKVRQVMNQLVEADREILIMRNLEQLSNQEVAQVLKIMPATASQRYGRAILRLRQLLIERNLLES